MKKEKRFILTTFGDIISKSDTNYKIDEQGKKVYEVKNNNNYLLGYIKSEATSLAELAEVGDFVRIAYDNYDEQFYQIKNKINVKHLVSDYSKNICEVIELWKQCDKNSFKRFVVKRVKRK